MQENYIVVSNIRREKLVIEVNERMSQGYVPQGGLCVALIEFPLFSQAMILNKQEQKENG